ncbi:hybrid sensor histidine kinase/response regulator [Paraburkholderia sp. J12]|uniref:hybrid sensor histidine kinase/response regulator n=1 Tax=Paraburkholderia sp. J12 TaxID=2805432 RepID=UPI002ABE0CF0|nr:hybrid sensor histidine kinase/response regulator [Paraburkholderia sp. J12]
MKNTDTSFFLDFSGSALSILLVDDQPIVGEVIRRALRTEHDIALHVCTNAHEAMSMAREVKPSLILQDLIMPGIDGLDLVRAWRAAPETARVPIIVLSAKEEPVVKRAAFIAGANDYLVKLPDTIELTARIRYHSHSYLVARQRDEALDFLSHDMRSPQTSILALLDTYRREHGELPAPLARIDAHARRALALADSFIHLTRAQSQQDERGAVFLKEIVLDAVDQLWEKAAALGNRIVAPLPDIEDKIFGDRMMLTRAISNLIDNALKYGPPGASVHCTLRDDGNAWVIGVEDAGNGIALDQREAATRSFVQFGPGHSRTRDGFGLGLAFVCTAAARHHGQIVMGDTERGFSVALRLPKQSG